MTCMKSTITFLIALLCIGIANAQVKHYTVKDGLQTNEVRQVIELPNGQVLVNCEGVFDLFDGRSFHEIPYDRSRSYRLNHYKGYLHLWQGDSLLWLRDFYRLYLFDARTLSFRYDIENRMADDKVLRQMAEEHETYESPDNRWQQIADSIGTGSRLAHVLIDRQGGTWLGTQSNGLFYIRPPRPQAQFIATNDTLRRRTYGMTDRRGRTWLCTAEGLECYDHGHVAYYTQKNVSEFLHNRMIFIAELQDGRLLLCNLAHYLGYFYPEKQEFQPLNKTLPELENYRVLIGACPLGHNKVAVYSQNGAFVLDTEKNCIEPFKPAEKISQFSDKYNCMLMDSNHPSALDWYAKWAFHCQREKCEALVKSRGVSQHLHPQSCGGRQREHLGRYCCRHLSCDKRFQYNKLQFVQLLFINFTKRTCCLPVERRASAVCL